MSNVKKQLRENELNKDAIQEIMRRKDRLESEVEQLKSALEERYIERSKVDEWKLHYEAKIDALKTQYDAAVQTQVKAKLMETQLTLGQQVLNELLQMQNTYMNTRKIPWILLFKQNSRNYVLITTNDKNQL